MKYSLNLVILKNINKNKFFEKTGVSNIKNQFTQPMVHVPHH